jgi:Flp pilus assembly pilin Flp
MIFQRFINCRKGASAVEYSLLAAGIALAVLIGAFALGADLGAFFNSIIDIFNG